MFWSLLSSQCLTCSIPWGSGRSFKSTAPITEWISFFCAVPFLFARSAAQKWNGKDRQPPGTHLSPGGFLKKREPRVPETAVDTQLGLGSVWSGSNISINRGICNGFVLSALKTFQECQAPPSYRCLSVPTVEDRGNFQIFIFCWNLKRAFKWFTGRIKTLRLVFQNEYAIESSKRNQNIGISRLTFWWETVQQNWRLWTDRRFHKHLKWRRIASSHDAADKTDWWPIVVSDFD
jgi:hypothetical protein